MAGRGRGATLPAWMTAGGGADAAMAGNGHMGASSGPSQNSAAGQFEDYKSSSTNQPPRYQDAYAAPAQVAHTPMGYSVGSAPPSQQYNQRQDSRGRDDGRRDGARSNGRERPARSNSRSK